MADKKSTKDQRGVHSPHPFQQKIKPVDLPPLEDAAVPQEGAPAQASLQPPNAPGNQGAEGDQFKSAKDRQPSPHPRQLRQDHVDTAGARTTDFGMSEAIVSTGAVGGSVTNVDVHPHGEVKQAMVEKEQSKEANEAPDASTHGKEVVVHEAGGPLGALIRSFTSRVQRYAARFKHRNRGFPAPIPEPLPPTEFSSDSGTHESLASGPLNLPDINYSVTDSEATSDQTSDRPVADPVQHSPEEEQPDPRATSVPEAEHEKPEDPGRRAKSAAAVLETAVVLPTSHDSDHYDSEDDQDGAEDLHDDGSKPVPAVSSSMDTPGHKSPIPHRESEGGLDSRVIVLPQGTELHIPQGHSQSTSVMQPQQDPSPSKMFLETEQAPGPSAPNVYLLRTEKPVEIRVSQDIGYVHTCISFEKTPPTSEEQDSGESDRDEE